MSEVVYLLHFEKPHPAFKRAIQHYIGRTVNLEARMQLHRNGRGAALAREMGKAGIGFEVVRTWTPEPPDTAAQLERRLKARKGAKRFCPKCLSAPLDNYGAADTNSES